MADIGRILGGLGAAVGGTAPQFRQQMMKEDEMARTRSLQDEEMAEKRRATMFVDAKAANDMLQRGDLQGFKSIYQDRLDILGNMPNVDTSHTRRALGLADAALQGDRNALEALARENQNTVRAGTSYGILKEPTAEEYTLAPNAVRMRGGEVIGSNIQEPAQFTQLSEDAVTRMGLDPNKRWQMGPDRKVSEIGGSGQTINIGGEKPSIGREAVDKAYADQYMQWVGVGRSQAFSNLAAIGGVLGQLERGEKLSGPAIGLAPNFILAITNPEATDARETVQGVVQQNLREILGGQFAQQEAQQLLDRAFNPALDPKINARRLRRLYNQMEIAAKQRDAMANYFDENETLRGFTGEQPKLSDFYTAVSDFEVGQEVDGYRYVGGDMSSPDSWEEVK